MAPIWGKISDDYVLPDNEKVLKFAENLISLYSTEAGKFLYSGRAVRTPEIVCDSEIYNVADGGTYKAPAVYGFSYEKGGRVCTVLANHTERDQKIKVGEREVTVDALSGKAIFC